MLKYPCEARILSISYLKPLTDRNLEVASANYVVVTDYSSQWRQCRGETISVKTTLTTSLSLTNEGEIVIIRKSSDLTSSSSLPTSSPILS